jgi:hypothetical protein
MITKEQAGRLLGAKVYDRNHTKIGNVGQLYLNTANNRPEFASVNTGLFGMNQTLVPIADAELHGDEIVVPFDKDTVKRAPSVDADADEPLSGFDINQLYAHYGVTGSSTDAFTDASSDLASDTMMGRAMIDEPMLDASRTAGRMDAPLDDLDASPDDRADIGTDAGTDRARLRRYMTMDRADADLRDDRLDGDPLDADRLDRGRGPLD